MTTLQQEEIYWKQISKNTWLKEGDANTKVFHDVANSRHNWNHVPYIHVNGEWI